MNFNYKDKSSVLCSKKCPKPVFFNNNNQPLNSSMTQKSKQSFLIENSYFRRGSYRLRYANSGENINNFCLKNSKFNVLLRNYCNNPPPKNSF